MKDILQKLIRYLENNFLIQQQKDTVLLTLRILYLILAKENEEKKKVEM